MPLFTVLSEFVHACWPLGSSDRVPRFLYGKSRRLLVPLMTVGTLFFFIQLVVPGTNNKPELVELWRIYAFPYQHFWFLQSIFLIFVVGLLDAFGLLRTPRRWSIAFTVALAIFLAGRVPGEVNVFSLNGAIRLLPFFLLGYGLHRYGRHLERRSTLTACLAVFALRLWTILGEPGFGALTSEPLRSPSGCSVSPRSCSGVPSQWSVRRELEPAR